MSKRGWLWVGGVVGSIFVLTMTPLGSTVFTFYILGAVPGTNLDIPAWVLMLVYPALIVVALWWLKAQPFASKTPPSDKQQSTLKASAKKTTAQAAKRRSSAAV